MKVTKIVIHCMPHETSILDCKKDNQSSLFESRNTSPLSELRDIDHLTDFLRREQKNSEKKEPFEEDKHMSLSSDESYLRKYNEADKAVLKDFFKNASTEDLEAMKEFLLSKDKETQYDAADSQTSHDTLNEKGEQNNHLPEKFDSALKYWIDCSKKLFYKVALNIYQNHILYCPDKNTFVIKQISFPQVMNMVRKDNHGNHGMAIFKNQYGEALYPISDWITPTLIAQKSFCYSNENLQKLLQPYYPLYARLYNLFHKDVAPKEMTTYMLCKMAALIISMNSYYPIHFGVDHPIDNEKDCRVLNEQLASEKISVHKCHCGNYFIKEEGCSDREGSEWMASFCPDCVADLFQNLLSKTF